MLVKYMLESVLFQLHSHLPRKPCQFTPGAAPVMLMADLTPSVPSSALARRNGHKDAYLACDTLVGASNQYKTKPARKQGHQWFSVDFIAWAG